MSSKRIVASCAVMALIVAFGSWYAVGAFPLVTSSQQTLQITPGPLEQKAVPVTPENPVPRRVAVTPAEYPADAAAQNATGSITLQVTLDTQGRVAETRVKAFRVRSTAGQMSFTNVSSADFERFVAEHPAGFELRGLLDSFVRSAVNAVQQWRYEAPYQGPMSFPVTVGFAPERTGGAGGGANAAQEPSVTWTSDGALRIGGMIKAPTKTKDVKPEYPAEAMASRITGVVIIEARIDTDGRVTDARVLRSIPMLDQAAIDSVMQWEFTPTLLNGQAVPVVMTVTVNFTLR